ncbi:MAG: proline dehydrogenase family protein [Acidimicrobiales bacterium]
MAAAAQPQDQSGGESAGPPPSDADSVVAEAVALVEGWIGSGDVARRQPLGGRPSGARRLAALIDDPAGLDFAMRFVDRVVRPDDDLAAAEQLSRLVTDGSPPGFLPALDRILLSAGAKVAARLPRLVMPAARRRLRHLVGHLIADGDERRLGRHLATSRAAGFAVNVNLLGEAVLGETEADSRLRATAALLARDDVDYVSVKASSVASQLNMWAFEATVERVMSKLRVLYDVAVESTAPKFVNLDMEEHRDLHLTIEAFTRVLSEDAYLRLPAGIVLQAYLPDSFTALQHLVAWADRRRARGGAEIRIRLVKGANLAMERAEAALHGWQQAPYATKAETDANYKRCVDWIMWPERMGSVGLGVASHNLFDVAWARLLSERRGVTRRVHFEMLQGMAPDLARLVRDRAGGLLLYTPVVGREDFDSAIAYLFRRLEENASDDNFIRHVFTLRAGSSILAREESRFRAAVAERDQVGSDPRRRQDRRLVPPSPEATGSTGGRSSGLGAGFCNEPDTDPALAANRAWAGDAIAAAFRPVVADEVVDRAGIDTAVARVAAARDAWRNLGPGERAAILRRTADELRHRRGDLLNAMAHEAFKTVSEADPEVSEAIDFARWYADRARDIDGISGAEFEPLGVMAVIAPWNFPVAIPAGGVLAALAAGNAVVFKPSKEAPRCAEIVAEACWAAGVPHDVLQFVHTTDRELGRHLVTHGGVDGVILTGSWATAQRFLRWRPDLALFAETSGKNAMIITPHADLDLAAADLVRSAFAHSGQKCSAASLAILVGDVYESPRLRQQLVDATRSLAMGDAAELSTKFGPVIRPPGSDLRRGLTTLDDGESWLLRPELLGEDPPLWSPGIRTGVRSGSWFHTTECFGPVLGLMPARDLDHAIEIQNSSDYGLTGGIQSLEPSEIERWIDRVEVGNAYVNRHTTGAIVARQPFGGWKRSVVGPGFKAGGPNYLHQLGRWTHVGRPAEQATPSASVNRLITSWAASLGAEDRAHVRAAAASDQWWWEREFSVEHDPVAIVYEANRFRYRSRPAVTLRIEHDGHDRDAARAILAGTRAGVTLSLSSDRRCWLTDSVAPELSTVIESTEALVRRLPGLAGGRIRLIGTAGSGLHAAANPAGIDVITAPVVGNGRIELMWYLREQVVSETMHRFGNLLRRS